VIPVRPMKAVAGDLPADDAGWAFEVKWDGMRVVAEVAAGRVRLWSANGIETTAAFPELGSLVGCVGSHDVVIDGEVVALDDLGVPSFGRLQQRMHVTDPAAAARRARDVPVRFEVFDLLACDGVEVWPAPWERRRALLGQVVEPAGAVDLPPVFRSGGAELLDAARSRGLEGIVAKRVDAPYEPGKRSARWRKVKVRHLQEFVVAGWLGGAGNRSGAIGSLVLGCHEVTADSGGPTLRWVGNVGTGFSAAELVRLAGLVESLARDACPFAAPPPAPTGTTAHWVEPRLVVQVEFAEWTADRRLRHPAYVGERTDKAAAEVTCAP
jgi:bifunctional non-homologous end joining protein LigD